jgi:ribosomal protein L30E
MEQLFSSLRHAAVSVWRGSGGPAGEASSGVIPETPSESQSDDESQSSGYESSGADMAPAPAVARNPLNPKFRFKCDGGILTMQGITDTDQYINAVTRFVSKPVIGRRSIDAQRPDASQRSGMMKCICIGNYTVQELCEQIRDAADAAGFHVYEHKGHSDRVYGNRCTLKFACDCGRKRAENQTREPIQHTVELDTIVRTDCRKKRTARRGHGYIAASTMHRRCKIEDCPFQFSVISYQSSVKFNVDVASEWQLSSHKRSVHNFEHVGHTLSTSGRTKLSEAAKHHILTHCDEVPVPQLVDEVARLFKIDTNADAVRWVLRANFKTSFKGNSGRFGSSGSVTETVKHLLKKKAKLLCCSLSALLEFGSLRDLCYNCLLARCLTLS